MFKNFITLIGATSLAISSSNAAIALIDFSDQSVSVGTTIAFDIENNGMSSTADGQVVTGASNVNLSIHDLIFTFSSAEQIDVINGSFAGFMTGSFARTCA